LPREDVAIDVDGEVCPCCGGALHAIGETVSEMLDFVPARLRVLRIRRPKYGCRACGSIHQASAPQRPGEQRAGAGKGTAPASPPCRFRKLHPFDSRAAANQNMIAE
jgi:transposase